MEEFPLNQQVAEKLGYSLYHYDKGTASECYYLLQDEEGHTVSRPGEMGASMGHRKTEAEAWKTAPPFDSDIQWAMTLLKNRTWDLGHSMFRGTYSCSIVPMYAGSEFPNNVTAEDAELEVAICKAFLQLDLETEAKVKALSDARKKLQYQEELVQRLEDELKSKD